ncbi:MAG: ComF family protein [Nitrospinae bacterium]|jgi:competence protein ComFC|nr:ComF family protein [Nitrospinota bacterium]MDA1109069.1 ComF family protein [Nitrospinota bacterium]
MIIFEKIKRLGRGTLAALLEGLFPRNCIFCEKSRDRGGEFLCGLCENEIAFIDPPFCRGCGIPADISYETPKENFECALCRKNLYTFDRARSLGPYDSVLKQLILHLKFCNQPGVMKDIVPLLAGYFEKKDESWEGFYVAPVPLHFRRMKARTFDQSFLLAREVARTLSLPLANGLLLRVKDTESQAKKTRVERAKNIKGAFQVNRPERVAGLDILLVDDVLTTGATANEAAKVLKRAGAGRVDVFTLARALPYGNAIETLSS